MARQILKNRLLMAMVLLLAFSLSYSSNAFAWGGRGHYYYRGGRWYDGGWFWGGAAAALTIGAIVATLPPHYETVYVSGFPYYYYDDVYYRPSPGGYVVVPAPLTVRETPADYQPAVINGVTYYLNNGIYYLYTPYGYQAVQPQPLSPQNPSVTVNIPNAKGGYKPVVLKRSGKGFVGPQGEFYSEFPTDEQLKVLYGE